MCCIAIYLALAMGAARIFTVRVALIGWCYCEVWRIKEGEVREGVKSPLQKIF